MTSDEYDLLWIPACRSLGLIPNNKGRWIGKGSDILDDLLGVTEFKNWLPRPLLGETPMQQDLKNLLRGLSGPHALTILRAYRIKKGLGECEIEKKLRGQKR